MRAFSARTMCTAGRPARGRFRLSHRASPRVQRPRSRHRLPTHELDDVPTPMRSSADRFRGPSLLAIHPDGGDALCRPSMRRCLPPPCQRHWCSWLWKVSRPRRTHPHRNPIARTKPVPNGCRRRNRLPALPKLRQESGLMSASASRTESGVPEASSTSEYFENTAIPGPIIACCKSTGAMLLTWSCRIASGSSRWSSVRKSRRVVLPAASGRGRQTIKIAEASALESMSRERFSSVVRTGQVAVIMNPASSNARSITSQPVDAADSPPCDSCCLKEYTTVIGVSERIRRLSPAKTSRKPSRKYFCAFLRSPPER